MFQRQFARHISIIETISRRTCGNDHYWTFAAATINACDKSVCSVLVGIPVDGPPRCTSITTKGNSAIVAKPIASDLSDNPVRCACSAKQPANDAPMAVHMPAISSSA